MPEAILEKDRAQAGAGRTGTPDGGDAGEAALAAGATVLTPETFRTIGSTLNGKHWQADIGQLIGISRSQVTRYLNGERDINPLVPRHLQYVIVERIQALADLLELPGMPYAGSDVARKARKQIIDATIAIPGQEPPRSEPI